MNPRKRSPRRDKLCIQKMPAVPAFKYFWFVNPKHAMTIHLDSQLSLI